MDSYNFSELKEELNLKCDFSGFSTMLIKLVNSCITDPDHYQVTLDIGCDAFAELNFYEVLDFKNLCLL